MQSTLEPFLGTLLTEVWGIPADIGQQIGYGESEIESGGNPARIQFVASNFFAPDVYGTSTSLPALPLKSLDGIPLLFGEPIVETAGGQILIHADIIASSYFLMTRYEEMVRRDCRDHHGRFPGSESLPAKAGFIQRPIVDEYGRWLRKLLSKHGFAVPTPNHKFKLTLTHDVDHPRKYNKLKKVVRGMAANLLRWRANPIQPLGCYLAGWNDPYDSFEWIAQQNLSAKKQLDADTEFEEIFFFMASEAGPHDGNYKIESQVARELIAQLKGRGATIGIHPSFAAGGDPTRIVEEIHQLENVANQSIDCSRHHYLRFREPEHFQHLVDAGITDDYTGGYADQPGFRFGTCQPFRFFNPVDKRPTQLTFHPLQIMEVSFAGQHYLGLPIDQAMELSKNIIRATRQHSGELVLLFHNNSFANPTGEYHRDFYQQLLKEAINCDQHE